MDALEYAEKTVNAALSDARSTYDQLHERAYKFVTLAMGAAGAVCIYALGKLGTNGYLLQVLPLGSLAAWWFCVAAVLLLKGASTNEMTVGTSSASIRERIAEHSKGLDEETASERALALTR